MMTRLRQELCEKYGLQDDIKIKPDNRGMINSTFFIGEERVLTIFLNRSGNQVDLIAEIVRNDKSGLMPPIIESSFGPVIVIDNSPAIMWQRIDGKHFVRRDHSDKVAIPEEGHISIAQSFWSLHATLGRHTDQIGTKLGQVHYLPASESEYPAIEFSELPDFLQTGLIIEYLQAETLPLKYPSLVHHDMERQNFLHDEKGIVTGIVDADSFKRGDVLFEYCRCMMNFMFSDPDYKPAYADHYMRALIESSVINAEDVKVIPELIRAFVAKDLLDYCRYESNPPKTNLSQLTAIYDKCLVHVEAYFSSLSLPSLKNTMRMPVISAPSPKPTGP